MGAQKSFALILGIVLLLVGILGFFDNPIVGNNGYFGTNTYQDILHLIAGACGVYAGTKGKGSGYNMIIGWIGIALAVLGFIQGIKELFLSLLNINIQITVLHLVLGIITLLVAYGVRKE